MSTQKSEEERIFEGAQAIADLKERSNWLRAECGDNSKLLDRVIALLQVAEGNSSFLEALPSAIAETGDLQGSMERAGDSIGRYKLLQKIGEGGFGIVYMAEQQQPMRRKVALKIIKPGMDSREVIVRFEAERQALALMDHPNIARVFDGGVTSTGRPYFVMELVKGIPLTQFCDENRIDTPRRLRLFADICRAIQHAHQKGVIHRDIKPSNVMVTMLDEVAVPKVIDFGVAKAISQQLTEKTLFTAYGQMIGTPQYMSPEQAELSGLDIDTRSDIYSLGVLLYELLTGTTPLDIQVMRGKALAEMQRMIRESEAVAPSLRLTTRKAELASIAAQRNTEPRKLSALVRGELDWIVLKALEKNRSRRYETASDMAHDVDRYLNREPVLACPPTLTYRLTKTFRKHRVAVTVAAALFLTLASGLATTFWQYQNAVHQASVATEAQLEADQARQNAIDKSQQLEQSVGQLTEARNMATQALAERGEALVRSEALRLAAQSSAELGKDPGLAMLLGIESMKLLPESSAGNNATLAAINTCREIRTFQHPSDSEVQKATFSPDQKLILAVEPTRIAIWEVETGKLLAMFDPEYLFQNLAAKFSPDSRHIAVYGGGGSLSQNNDGTIEGFTDRVVRIWDVYEGKEIAVLRGHSDRVSDLCFNHDGSQLATASWDGTARIWEVTKGEQTGRFELGETLETVVFSPDEKWLIAGKSGASMTSSLAWDFDEPVQPTVIDPPLQFLKKMNANGSPELRPETSRRISGGQRSSFDSRKSSETVVVCWEIESGEIVNTIERRRYGSIEKMESISKSGQSQLLLSDGRNVLLWDLLEHTSIAECQVLLWNFLEDEPPLDEMKLQFKGDRKTLQDRCLIPYRAIEFLTSNQVSPDGKLVVNVQGDVLNLTLTEFPNTSVPLVGHHGEEYVRSAVFSMDRSMILSAGDNTVRLWDATGVQSRKHRASTVMREKFEEPIHVYQSINKVQFSPDGKQVATAGNDKYVRLYSSSTGEQLAKLLGNKEVDPLASRWRSDQGIFQNLVGTLSGSPSELRQNSLGEVTSIRFSPDGLRIAAVSEDPFAFLTSEQDADEKLPTFQAIPFTPARIWDLEQNRLAWACPGSSFRLPESAADRQDHLIGWGYSSAVFSSDGSMLITLDAHEHFHKTLAPDGSETSSGHRSGLAVSVNNGESGPYFAIRSWDAATGQLIRTIASDVPARRCFLSDNGMRGLVEDKDGFRIVDPTTGRDICRLDGTMDAGDDPVAFSPDNQWMFVTSDDALWNISTGKLVWKRPGAIRDESFVQADYKPNDDHQIRPHIVRFTPDSKRIVTASTDSTARVWDVRTGQYLRGFFGHSRKINCLDISRNGKWCVTGSADETARVWSTATGIEGVAFPTDSELTAVSFDCAGNKIATASGGIAQVWPLNLLALAESRVPRQLNDEERTRYETGVTGNTGK